MLGAESLEDRALLAVTLEVSPVILLEDSGAATITARLSQVVNNTVTVTLGFTGTATRDTDYAVTGTQIVIPAGQTSGSIQLTSLADETSDNNETIIIDIESVTNDTESGTQSSTLRILESLDAGQLQGVAFFDFDGDGTQDDNEPGIPGIPVVLEGITDAGQSISLEVMTDDDGSYGFIHLPPGTYSVEFATIAALPTPSVHVGSAGGTVSGRSVTSIDLDQDETASGYSISFASLLPGFVSPLFLATNRPPLDELYRELLATGEQRAGRTAVANRIREGVTPNNPSVRSAAGEDEPHVDLSFSPSSIDENGGPATLTATLSTAATRDVIIRLLVDGTATNNTDYQISSTQIVIPAGQRTGTVTITPTNDTAVEGDETVRVRLDSVSGARFLEGEQAELTIRDDESANIPTVTLSRAAADIVENGGSTTVTATLSTAATTQVTVTLGFGGTAVRGTDYTASATQIVIPAGQTTGQITLTSTQDSLDELNETIIVSVDSVTGAQEAGTQQVEVRITDDDPSPTVSIAPSSTSLAESGGTAQITATLSAVSGQPVSVDLSFAGTAQSGVDYQRSGQRITIPAGQLSASITLTGLNDDIDEPDETIVVTATTATGANLTGTTSHTINIQDDDLPSVQLTATQTTVTEENVQVTVRAVLAAAVDEDVVVTLGYTGTATNEDDYNRSGTQITIPAGELSGEVVIDILEDSLDEDNETIVVDITSVTGAAERTPQQVVLSIQDDDPMPMVTLTADATTLSEDGGSVVITATLDQVSGRDVTVELDVSGTATENTDFEVESLTIVIPAGQTSGTATVTALADDDEEEDETVIVDILSVENGTEDDVQRVTLTIQDDGDGQPTVTLNSSATTLEENGGEVTVTVQLSEATDEDVVVTLALAGAAEQGVDYNATGTQITIPAGETSGEVTISALDDSLDEDDETIVIDISSVTGAVESSPQQVTLSIQDDDPMPMVTLSADATMLDEDGGSVVLTATLDQASGRDVTVELGASGTATENTDFEVEPLMIVIPAGQTSGTATVTALNDDDQEDDETVVVDIVSVENGTEDDVQSVTLTIQDDDEDDEQPSVTLINSATTLEENGGEVTITAQLSQATDQDVVVTLALAGVAEQGVDYNASATQITIPAGETSASIMLTAIDDEDDEDDEEIAISIMSVTNAQELTPQDIALILLDDDDESGSEGDESDEQSEPEPVDDIFSDPSSDFWPKKGLLRIRAGIR